MSAKLIDIKSTAILRSLHSSRPNRSNFRRIGVALQQYIRPDVRQVIGQELAMQGRGADRFGHHRYLKRPTCDLSVEGQEQWDLANDNWNEILYAGAGTTRDY